MDLLTCRKLGRCLLVRVHGPARENGWLERAADELASAFEDVNLDEEVWTVVLSYPGDAFRQAYAQRQSFGELRHLFMLPEVVGRIRKPVIAALHGNTDGFGMELALACDLRIGTEGASYGMAQLEHGCMPMAGGTQRLARVIGTGMALEMILAGRRLDDRTALDIRLIDRIAAPDQLLDTALTMARGIACCAPLAANCCKEAVHGALDHTLDRGLRMEMDLYFLLFSSRDRFEGITAFRERRPPRFEGV